MKNQDYLLNLQKLIKLIQHLLLGAGSPKKEETEFCFV